MRVAILTQYYPPEIGAPQARLASLAGTLRDRGHDVWVLSAMPNYPIGRLYPGYHGFFRSEIVAGIRVYRSWIYATRGRSVPRRLANYLSFSATSLLAGAIKLPKVDILLTESPPLFLGITGLILAKLKGARWVLNISDLWPDSVEYLGVMKSGRFLRAAHRLERFLYRKAWLVSGQTKGIVSAVAERAPSTPTYHFSNGVDRAMFDGRATSSESRSEPVCRVLYAGLLGLAQGLDVVLDAIEVMGRRDDLLFEFVGDGPEKEALIARAATAGLENIVFRDPVPHAEVPELLSRADIAIVPLRFHIDEAVPSKLYEAMASGTAIVLVSTGEAAALLRQAGAGVVVEPGDVAGIARAFQQLVSDADERQAMGLRGKAYSSRFDRNAINRRLIDELESRLSR